MDWNSLITPAVVTAIMTVIIWIIKYYLYDKQRKDKKEDDSIKKDDVRFEEYKKLTETHRLEMRDANEKVFEMHQLTIETIKDVKNSLDNNTKAIDRNTEMVDKITQNLIKITK